MDWLKPNEVSDVNWQIAVLIAKVEDPRKRARQIARAINRAAQHPLAPLQTPNNLTPRDGESE